MKTKNLKIKSTSDNLDIDLIVIEADRPKGIVQIAHGMTEHKERYMPFLEFLAANGYHAVISDHRGHGESVKTKEDLGYFYDDSANAIVDDLYDVTLYIKNQYPNLDVYLFGHSMGSLVVRNYISKYGNEIKKLIVCGAPCNNALAPLGILIVDLMIKIKGDRYRSNFITSLALGNGDKKFEGELKNRWLSKNQENVKKYNAHPKDGFTFTLNGYRNLFILLKNTYNKKQAVVNPNLPILFIAGEDDPIIGNVNKWQKAMLFMSDIGYKDIQSVLYKEMRHEILNETDSIKVKNDILSFIEGKAIKNVN